MLKSDLINTIVKCWIDDHLIQRNRLHKPQFSHTDLQNRLCNL